MATMRSTSFATADGANVATASIAATLAHVRIKNRFMYIQKNVVGY